MFEVDVMMTWVLELEVFSDGERFKRAVESLGHQVVEWRDSLWTSKAFPEVDGPVVFRGSLDNAARLVESGRWRPGSFCDTRAFYCSEYYPRAMPWMLARSFELSTVAELCEASIDVARRFGDGQVFVRPDSPLKPFSGRVVEAEGLTPAMLDHGFYYDDLDTPVIVSRVKEVGREWRFVVVDGVVVAASPYEAQGRTSSDEGLPDAVGALAEEIAARMVSPERVYVLDLCESEGEIYLLELNPFGGADLYGCDSIAVARAIERMVLR